VIPGIIFYNVLEFTVSVKEYLVVAATGWWFTELQSFASYIIPFGKNSGTITYIFNMLLY
jgi:hypothetical protein